MYTKTKPLLSVLSLTLVNE